MDYNLLLQDLANMIIEAIKGDFKDIYLSGNLRDTITLERSKNGFRIVINARIYDLVKFKKDNVIIYTGDGSYASDVDVKGGFSGKHKDYVERAIYKSIPIWIKKHNLKGVVK